MFDQVYDSQNSSSLLDILAYRCSFICMWIGFTYFYSKRRLNKRRSSIERNIRSESFIGWFLRMRTGISRYELAQGRCFNFPTAYECRCWKKKLITAIRIWVSPLSTSVLTDRTAITHWQNPIFTARTRSMGQGNVILFTGSAFPHIMGG